jgi:hypothetical protein
MHILDFHPVGAVKYRYIDSSRIGTFSVHPEPVPAV